jgi:hypothetical protein
MARRGTATGHFEWDLEIVDLGRGYDLVAAGLSGVVPAGAVMT